VSLKFPPPPGFSAKMFEDAHIQAALRPLKQDIIGNLGRVLWILMASIGVVLLIACANVANLLLVHAETRQHEVAIRTALGAGSARIAAEFLAESVFLSVLGGAAGLGLAYAALRLLVARAPAFLPRLEYITIDPVVLLFTVVLALLAGVLLGLMPALRFASPGVMAALRAGGRTLSQSKETLRTRSSLVVLQVALAMVLLISSGLMIRTFLRLRDVRPGFTSPRELQTLAVSIPESQIKEAERVVRMEQDILGKIAAVPGVSSAAFANSVPTDGNDSTDVLYTQDKTYAEGQFPPLRRFKFVTPGFFHTMGTRLIAGRDLTWSDIYDQRPVAVVSENMARELWREPAAALGKRIREGMKDPWREIIGVVQDIRSDGADQKAPTTVYWPTMMKNFWGLDEFVQRRAVFAVRSTRAGSESFLKELRQAVWAVDPDTPLAGTRTLDEIYRSSMARSSFALVMLAIAGGMALLLGIVGIYGVISYSVSQRSREMGIRMALGAGRNTLAVMIVRQGLQLTAIGVAIGFVTAMAVTRMMASLLFEVRPVDPFTYGVVAAGLLAAAATASYIPAHRAAAVNPAEALRAE
jgi:predicted permease